MAGMTYLLVGVGGFLGAIARYVIDGWVSQRTGGAFPWGTLLINVSGSLVVGFLFAITVERGILPAESRAPLMIGFVGAYTTFSTLMLESWRLIEDGALLAGVANIAGSSVLGIVAVVAGLTLGRAIA
jgi:CrcB protein